MISHRMFARLQSTAYETIVLAASQSESTSLSASSSYDQPLLIVTWMLLMLHQWKIDLVAKINVCFGGLDSVSLGAKDTVPHEALLAVVEASPVSKSMV